MYLNSQDFKVGDTVWYNDGFKERLSGTVYKVLTAEELNFYDDHYLIMVHTHIDDYLIVRPKGLTYATKEVDMEEAKKSMQRIKQMFSGPMF